MQITFLGTGTSQGVPVINCDCPVCCSLDPKDKRLRCAVLIQENNSNYVIDIGPDFRQQMLKNEVKWLNGILITHEHNDHIIGLDDVRPFNFKQREEMKLYAAQQVLDDLSKRFEYVFSESPYPGAPRIHIFPIENKPFIMDNIPIIPIKVKHGNLDVFGFRIKDFCYVTDANFIAEEEKEKLKNAKILVLNALHREKHYSHFNLAEALEIIDELKPEQAYLTHLSHRMGSHEETSKELPPNVQLAYDGLKLEI